MSFQDHPPVFEPIPGVLIFVAPKQSLNTLGKWRNKWVRAQRRGIAKRIGEDAIQFNNRSLAFQQKCVKAIAEIDRCVAARQTPDRAIRSCIPKKQQRAMGILPPVGYEGGPVPYPV